MSEASSSAPSSPPEVISHGPPEPNVSVPTTFVPAPNTRRPATPRGGYPYRRVDEMEVLISPAVAPPRNAVSLATTRAERRAKRRMDTPNDWHEWTLENDPVQTEWRGPDQSWFTLYGGAEDGRETAAVETETVMQSIELESDPLVAVRSTASDSLLITRRENRRGVRLEDRVRRRDQTIRTLRIERDEARHAEDELHERQHGLQDARQQAEAEARQVRGDRDYYRDETRTLGAEMRALENVNADLQAQVRDLNNQLLAARALLVNNQAAFGAQQPPVAPVVAAPIVQPQVVVQQPVAGAPANAVRGRGRGRGRGGARGAVRGGVARGGARGRAGRGARAGATAPARRREQPGRSCKVEKNYRD